jgi:NADPH-dependent 2,4-dienoyl-CoA reductase/sulfur reductase-like enzyme
MSRRRTLTRERVVIVGAGRAGVSAAEELRRSGFQGEVVVFSEEAGLPYYRPSCSKGLLTGAERPSDVVLDLSGCVNVRWRFGQRIASVDPIGRVVETDGGEVYPYDGLIIATGSRAVPPPKLRGRGAGLHTLHRLEDAWALRRSLRDANRVAVVGGGLTGCETAWAVRSLARECVLIDSNPQVMTRALGKLAGRVVTEQLWREGVELCLGCRVQAVDQSRSGRWWLTLDDDTEVDADVIVFTTGDRPDTSWLKGTPGLDVSDGVLCDENLRVVGAEGIVAAGAVARWPNLRTDSAPQRSGQWINALQHGRAAARALLAGDEPVPPVVPLHQLWSEQFGLRIQVAGNIGGKDTQVHLTRMHPTRRDTARSGLLVSYVKDDRLAGLFPVNAPQVYTTLARSMLVAPQLEARTTASEHIVEMAELRSLVRPESNRRPTHIVSSSLPDRGVSGGTQRPAQQRPVEHHSAPVPVAAVLRPPRSGSADGSTSNRRQEPVEHHHSAAPRAHSTVQQPETTDPPGESPATSRPIISVSRPGPDEEPVSWAYS